MTNIKDFKIGNLVNWDIYENLVVEGIIAYQFQKDSLHLKGLKDGKEFVVNASIGNVEPIKLTDEFILENGFEKVGNRLQEKVDIKKYATIRLCDVLKDGNYTVSIGDDDFGVALQEIKYVHEFQNLIYTLLKH